MEPQAAGGTMRVVGAATVLTALVLAGVGRAQVTASPLKAGDVYSAESTETLNGKIDFKKPGDEQLKRHEYSGQRRARYVERVLAAKNSDDGIPERVLRTIERLESSRKIADSPQVGFQLRDEAKHVVLHRGEAYSKPFSLRGPLLQQEIHALSHMVFVPALNGLLPKGALEVGSRWTANRRAVAQLAGMVPLESGDLTCTVKDLNFDFKGKKLVQIEFSGVLSGTAEEGKVKDDILGSLYLDRETGKVHSLTVEGTRTMYDEKKNVVGTLAMTYKLAVRTTPPTEDLSDAIAAEAAKDPTPEQTAVLYEFPPCAAKLVHPRTWLLERAEGTTLYFSYGREGYQLTINFHEDDKTPSAEDYRKEVKENLKREGFKDVTWTVEPKERVIGAPGAPGFGRAGLFQARAKKDGDWLMTYFVRQVERRGATAAVFLHSKAAEEGTLDKDGLNIMKSVEFTNKVNPFFVKAKAPAGNPNQPANAPAEKK